MPLDPALFPTAEIVFPHSDYTSERTFRLLVAQFTRQGFPGLAENLLQLMKKPPTVIYTDLLLLVHQASGELWSKNLGRVVDIAKLGLTQPSFDLVARYQRVLDVTFNYYATSHPAFSRHLVGELVTQLPPKKLSRLLTKGLKTATDPGHAPGDHLAISMALSECIRLAIQDAYPGGAYFREHLSAADNRTVYRRMGWREAMEHMKASDHESQLAEELGL